MVAAPLFLNPKIMTEKTWMKLEEYSYLLADADDEVNLDALTDLVTRSIDIARQKNDMDEYEKFMIMLRLVSWSRYINEQFK